MAIRFPGPWAYAGAGLTGGVGEGLMLGMQARRQKEELEQQKRARAMQLIMGAYKVAQDNPDLAKPLFEKLGIQAPQLPTPEQKREQLQSRIEAWKQKGYTPEQAMALENVTPPKTSQAMPFVEKTPEGWRPIPGKPWAERPAPAYTQPYQVLDEYGNPVTTGTGQRPVILHPHHEKEPKPKSQKEQNYEAYSNHMKWIDQNFPEGDPSKAAQRQEEIKKAMKRAARLGIVTPKAAELEGEE